MTYRSLHKNQAELTLGLALFLVTPDLVKLPSSTSTRIDFRDEKSLPYEYFSLEGTLKEVGAIDIMFQIYGPAIPSVLLSTVPLEYEQLRETRRNPIAKKQAIAFTLKREFRNLEIPDVNHPNFIKNVKKFEAVAH